MVLVAITVKAEPVTDTENRAFGLAIDQTLNPNFTESQPEKVLKNPDGSWLITNKAFTWSTVLNLAEGTHTIRFAPSSPSGNTWKATIIIDRINSLGEQTGLTSTSQYVAQFTAQGPTWERVRRAIYEADRYLEGLYQTIDWKGKTYGLIKSCPELPLSIVIDRPPSSFPPDWYNEDRILGPRFPCHKIDWVTGQHLWSPTARVVSVVEPQFEAYDAIVEIGAYYGVWELRDWVPIAKLHIKYGPDPADPTRMKAEIELLDWYKWRGEEVHGDIYFGAEPDPNRPGLYRPRKIIPDAHVKVGTKVTLTTSRWGCFPSDMYWLGETYCAALHWWFKKLRRSWVYPYMTNFLDDYALKLYIRGPAFLGTRTDYPDDWLTLTSEHNRICDVWEQLPRNPYCSSHWSSLCGPGAWIYFSKQTGGWCGGILGCFVSQAKAACLDCEHYNFAVSPHAITILCKYNDPKKKVWNGVYGMWDRRSKWEQGLSAEELLLTGYVSCACDTPHPPIKEMVYHVLKNEDPWEPDKPINGDVSIWFLAEALVALTIIGYGFEYEEAKLLADALANWMLELQWGVKPGEEGIGRLYVLHHDVWTSFTINRPDHRGGFYHRYAIIDNKVHWVRRPPRDRLQERIIWFMGWETPGGLGIFTPTSAEGTLCAVNALRIYEYYKWRIKNI